MENLLELCAVSCVSWKDFANLDTNVKLASKGFRREMVVRLLIFWETQTEHFFTLIDSHCTRKKWKIRTLRRVSTRYIMCGSSIENTPPEHLRLERDACPCFSSSWSSFRSPEV